MSKAEAGKQYFVGIDVSARELVVALSDGERVQMETVSNQAEGHRQLEARLRQLRAPVKICREASGTYSLDVALALARAGGHLPVSLVNPRWARRFAESRGQRSKTDPVDARALAQYAARMPLLPWQPPSAAALRLRSISRTISALVRMGTQHKNRQHALSVSAALPALLVRELEAQAAYTEKRIAKLRREARRLIQRDGQLLRHWQHLLSIPGVGEASGLAILAELAVLPAVLDARPWVAHSGLVPKHHQSGTAVEQKARISKAGNRYLRAALYMPALVAIQHEPWLRSFYLRRVGRGKPKLQALVAVLRKLLPATWGMFQHDQPYDGAKLCPQL